MNNLSDRLVNKTETEFEIEDRLSLSAREWLVTRLKHEPGIQTVAFSQDKPCNLKVTYRTSTFSLPTLLDVIQSYDSNARLLPDSSHEVTTV